MDWHAIFSQRLQQGLGPVAGGLLPRRHRPQRALRLHRPAQLRPGRLHGRRRLRRRVVRRHLGPVVLARHASSASARAVVLALLLGVPPCGCGPTTWRSSRSPRPRSSGRRSARSTLLKYFGGQDGLQGFNQELRRAEPVPAAASASPASVTWRPYDFWTLLVGWALVGAVLPHGVGADAQPLGPGAQGHPRGRGRRPQPRQERLRLQDAVADHRRRDRRPRRHHVGAAALRDQPVVLRDRHDVLRLHRAARRWRRPGARPGRRNDHLLVPAQLPRPVLRGGHLGRQPDAPGGDHEQQPGQPDAVHLHGPRADAADDLPTTRNLRRPKGAGLDAR